MLPDSNINEVASNGFFKYTVRQLPDLPIGTTFENSASIYFDFNDPVKTNTTFHSIGIATTIDTTEVVLCEGDSYEGVIYTQSTILSDTLAYSVFENINFQPNDNTVGWNGFFKGEKMNAAVFVYFAEIEFKDGKVEIFKGDVTIMK